MDVNTQCHMGMKWQEQSKENTELWSICNIEHRVHGMKETFLGGEMLTYNQKTQETGKNISHNGI